MSKLLFSLWIAFFALMFQAGLEAQSTNLYLKLPATSDDSTLQSLPTNGFSRPTAELAQPRIAGPVLNRTSDWYPFLITRPADRQWIKSIPIAHRPNRTFHVYGNAVREGLLPHGPLGQLVFGQ